MVLVAIEYGYKQAFFVGAPGNICQILFSRCSSFYKNSLFVCRIENPNSNLMAGHSCHRVFDMIDFSHAFGNINQWIIGHHRFVHAIKRQEISAGRPESAFADAKFVAVHRLSVYDTRVLVCGNSKLRFAV